MISVICVYNNQKTLKDVLLKSLANQTVEFELITLDNTGNRFKSAAEALNYGGVRARGDYLMFVHQDMWLGSDSWLKDVEQKLGSIPDLGVAGVAGVSKDGRNFKERLRFSIDLYDEGSWDKMNRPQEAEEVQTLDECLLIISRPIFSKLKFDENIFDGWDSYGVDYCLSVKQLGLKAYVVPIPCSHGCLRAHYQRWEFKGLLESQKKLYLKHGGQYKHIYTWMGEVSWLKLRLRKLAQLLGPAYSRAFPNLNLILQRELSGCDAVLDLGCGHHSPIMRCNIPFSVGVELFEPSLRESKRKGIYDHYIHADIRKLEFKPKTFDAVIAIEILRHLTKQEGYKLLNKMERWAKKKVVIITLNGYMWQNGSDDNPVQEHRSSWYSDELKEAGFKVHGVNGWKWLREYKGSFKYSPIFFWGKISDLSQRMTYYYPRLAFQLLAVKTIGTGRRK